MSYIEQLQNKNLKVTPQRLEIVDIITQQGHITIDNLYQSLQKKFPTLSLATVYKNINTMQEKEFVSEVKIPNQKNVYEIKKKKHSHIICTKCSNIIDINIDISDVIIKAKQASNYIVEDSSVVFSGICPKCQNL